MLAHRHRRCFIGAVIAVLLPVPVAAQNAGTQERLGEVDFANSCPESAHARFDRAVALLHHMTYSVAYAEFSAIADEFPTCAMAHWGIAMTLFQPLWPTRPSEDDLRRGRIEVSTAERIGKTTAREQMFIAAATAFFHPEQAGYWERIERWAEATRTLYESYPDDPEARAFFALSRLAVAEKSGDAGERAAAASVLAGILRDHPTHPGAVHYMIHANDAAGRERESLDIVRSYEDIAPRNPHALHMPTHVFVRLGLWSEVIEGNRRAAEAALAHPAGDSGQWVWDEFPHAIEYLVYALLQVGDDSAAVGEMTKLQRTPDLQPSFKTAFHLASVPARYALERRDWHGAARLDPRPGAYLPWDRFPWPEAVTWFARGLGGARSGDLESARTARARLATLEEASLALGEQAFARQIEILRLEVGAWIAFREGDSTEAVRMMQRAVTLESQTQKPPVTPAPTLPADELLGDLLLELDRPSEALRAYESSLRSAPNRFNSLVGAARAAARKGDDGLARKYYDAVRKLVVPDSPRRELAELAAERRHQPQR